MSNNLVPIGQKRVMITAEQDMYAFDSLPKKIRECLNYTTFSFSPYVMLERLNNGWSEQEIIESVTCLDIGYSALK